MKTSKVHHSIKNGRARAKQSRKLKRSRRSSSKARRSRSNKARRSRSSKARRSRRPKLKLKSKSKSKSKSGRRVRFSMGGGGTDSKQIILFKAKGCMHCENLKSAWTSLSSVPSQGVEYHELESSSSDYERRKGDIEKAHGVKIKVDGFPHIVKINRGKVTEYRGDRSEADMRKWVGA